MKNIIRKFGVFKSTLALSFFVIAISVGLSIIFSYFFLGRVTAEVVILPFLVSGSITAIFSPIVLTQIYQLALAEERLRKLSITDDLTRVYNRRHFIDLLEKEQARAMRFGQEFSVIIFDIDDFKRVNDEFGHQTGDQVLREVAQLCHQQARKADSFARFGGEEFIYLLPGTGKNDAMAFATRMSKLISETDFLNNKEIINITVSMGVNTYEKSIPNLDTLLHNADQALYLAKRRGKNCVVSVEDYLLVE